MKLMVKYVCGDEQPTECKSEMDYDCVVFCQKCSFHIIKERPVSEMGTCKNCEKLRIEIARLESIISDLKSNLDCVSSDMFEPPATWGP